MLAPNKQAKKLICSTSTFEKEAMRNHTMSRSALNEGHGTQLAPNWHSMMALINPLSEGWETPGKADFSAAILFL